MKGYDGICWMGYFLIILYFFGSTAVLYLILGNNVIWYIFSLIFLIIYGIIKAKNDKQEVKIDEDEDKATEFTDEDLVCCKVAEWVNK